MEQVEYYFFDSYALIELFRGNPGYKKYGEASAITTYFNLYEAYYNLRKEKTETELHEFFTVIKPLCINLSFDWIKESTDMKMKYSKRKLSYVDCLGYIIAKKQKALFLTGDNQFKDLENVEFVK